MELRLFLIETQKCKYILNDDLIVMLAWLRKGFDFLNNEAIEKKDEWVSADNKKLTHYELVTYYGAINENDIVGFRQYPIIFSDIFKCFKSALNDKINKKPNSNGYTLILNNWEKENGVISMTRCDEHVKEMLPVGDERER